ncbi:viroplasmin family protein [Dorea formicigenerans]|uniref:Ribonuclease H n=1 Tax=Dorea formicigenerans TaxID=39486 RepID=A0A413YI21_9FIRM|nr:viroplasmin family protein [Dorea formicigenerans]RHC04665.1 hypothetical protein DW860_12285 [Dorea formicigenerans]RHC19518.1 hypothetical protein DW854_11550 [Dorea formicigenerans]
MAVKYYAVKKGKMPGIYYSWNECKTQVDGFSGAEYKSFKSEKEARDYISDNSEQTSMNKSIKNTNTLAVEAYVDGSYNSRTNEFSYGMIILRNGEELKYAEKYADKEMASMHNVAGEIKGAEAAMRYAVENSLKEIIIYHDYEGIAKWCLGEWKANKEGTKAYKEYYDSVKNKVDITFVKVAGHSNNKYNDIADELAKQVLGIIEAKHVIKISKEKEDLDMGKAKSLYITRDIDKLTQLLDDTAKSIWSNVIGKGIKEVGQQKRYTFEVDGELSLLDIYQRGDGQTTLRPTGANIENATKLKAAVELRGYRATAEQKQYTMFVGEDWVEKTVQYLSGLCEGNVEKYEEEGHDRYVFVSDIGDKLTLHTYSNHRIMVQGKPLYLYNEFLSYVSYSPKVEVNDIIKATNEFIDTNTDVDEARNKMSEMMPVAYAGSVDPVIWKLFSPSVTLSNIEKDMEDYSCFTFPALRALEGYLKYLLAEKNIVIDEAHNFGTVFNKDSNDKAIVISKYVTDIADTDYVEALEEIYNYFKTNRHVIFHVDQILITTKVIENKQEATSIINDVAALIERTYKKAIK